MASDKAAHPERRMRFDGTVTAGNVLTAAAMMVALLGWGFRLEGRVDLQDEKRAALEQRFAESTAQTRSVENEIKSALRDMAVKIDRLIERTGPSYGREGR